MNLIERETTDLVNEAIDRLIRDFERYPNKYLTEEDVRLHLCHYLLTDFGNIEDTADDDKSIALHCEVRWWGPNKSKERSDIMIFDTADLNVTPEIIKSQVAMSFAPRKGYSINVINAVIELKLRRNVGNSDNEYRRKIQADIDKLVAINTIFESEETRPSYWVVALDKGRELANLPNSPDNINLRYAFATHFQP